MQPYSFPSFNLESLYRRSGICVKAEYIASLFTEQPVVEASENEAGLSEEEQTDSQRTAQAEQELTSTSGKSVAEPLGAADIDLMESLQDAGQYTDMAQCTVALLVQLRETIVG